MADIWKYVYSQRFDDDSIDIVFIYNVLARLSKRGSGWQQSHFNFQKSIITLYICLAVLLFQWMHFMEQIIGNHFCNLYIIISSRWLSSKFMWCTFGWSRTLFSHPRWLPRLVWRILKCYHENNCMIMDDH